MKSQVISDSLKQIGNVLVLEHAESRAKNVFK